MLSLIAQPFFLYMESMRSVTRKPPKMFTEARISAKKPKTRAKMEPVVADRRGIDADRQKGADHDDGGDRVGDRHQRRVQRGRHRPHDVIADEHGEREDRQAEHEGVDAAAGHGMDGAALRCGDLVGVGCAASAACRAAVGGGLGAFKELLVVAISCAMGGSLRGGASRGSVERRRQAAGKGTSWKLGGRARRPW